MPNAYSLRPNDGEVFGNTDKETDGLIMYIRESDSAALLRTTLAKYSAAVSVRASSGSKISDLLLNDINVRDIKPQVENIKHNFITYHFFVVFSVQADIDSLDLREIKNDAAFFVWQRLKRALRLAYSSAGKDVRHISDDAKSTH